MKQPQNSKESNERRKPYNDGKGDLQARGVLQDCGEFTTRLSYTHRTGREELCETFSNDDDHTYFCIISFGGTNILYELKGGEER